MHSDDDSCDTFLTNPSLVLKEGDRAPNFSEKDQDGQPVSLDERLAAGPLVIYFYPADFTPG